MFLQTIRITKSLSILGWVHKSRFESCCGQLLVNKTLGFASFNCNLMISEDFYDGFSLYYLLYLLCMKQKRHFGHSALNFFVQLNILFYFLLKKWFWIGITFDLYHKLPFYIRIIPLLIKYIFFFK